jgi:hypothetical protein
MRLYVIEELSWWTIEGGGAREQRWMEGQCVLQVTPCVYTHWF